MSKYYREEDIRHIIIQNNINNKKTLVANLIGIPTIEVVRCEECENFNPMTHGCKRSPSVEPWQENDFCSYGERIDNE